MTTNPSTNALGDTPPTVCPRCAGPCTLPGEGPTGQLGGLCTVCGWDYLVAGVEPDAAPATDTREDALRAALDEMAREWGPAPDATPCPAWCIEPAGHPWKLGDAPGDFARTHSAFYVEGPGWSVEAYRIEEAHRGVVTMGAPGVGVQVSDELDAGQALQLAAAVKRAAESAQGLRDALAGVQQLNTSLEPASEGVTR